MIILPKISSDSATTGVQSDPAIASGAYARRNSESQSSPTASNAADSTVGRTSEPPKNLPDIPASAATDSSQDIADGNAADAVMTSLRAGILAQPSATMLAQAGLSPQSVYDLLR